MEFVNLTPHAIVIYLPDGTTREIPPSGQVARLVDPSGPRPLSPVGGLPSALYSPLDGRRLDGLPEPRTGTVYITSILCLPVAQALGRLDVAAPDTDTGAVRVPKGQPRAGELLGVTRLIYAGDEPPAYRLVTGSATHGHGTPRDLDILGWSDAPIGREHRVIVGSMPMSADSESDYWRGAIDYHEVTPTIGLDGAWEIRVPVWADEDPSRPTLLWHSPCARPVRVVRDVLRTGPAQLRRYAATGVMPDFADYAMPDHGESSGALVVEMTVGGDAPGYRGCGLSAWRRAAERLSEAQITALPAHVQDLIRAVMTVDLAHIVERHARPATPEQLADMGGRPAASHAVTYYWHPDGYWTTPYGQRRYATFADVLAVWS